MEKNTATTSMTTPSGSLTFSERPVQNILHNICPKGHLVSIDLDPIQSKIIRLLLTDSFFCADLHSEIVVLLTDRSN